MMKLITILSVILFIGCNIVWSQPGHKQLREGDKAYKNQQYDQAAQHYSKAEEEKADFRASYNLGNTLMQQQKYEDAVLKYNRAADKSADPAAKASIYHNLGNALYEQEKYEESIDAYKKALTFRPSDLETLENLMLAKKRLRQQEARDRQQQQTKSGQDKAREQQGDKSPKQDSQDSTNSENKQESGYSKNNESSDEQQKQRLKENSSGLSDRDAGQLLEVMTDEEKRVQRKMTGKGLPKGKGRKDW